MSYRKVNLHNARINFHPSVADPAHLILYSVPIQTKVKAGLTEYTNNDWQSCSGGRISRFLIWLLEKAIVRDLKLR